MCRHWGTVQLPKHLTLVSGLDNVEFEYLFGEHVLGDPSHFDLVIHCDACMLNYHQKEQRVVDLLTAIGNQLWIIVVSYSIAPNTHP